MTEFTPYTALLGGVLIGAAAALLMLCNGRIAGISGILAGVMLPAVADNAWRYCFIAGLLFGPPLFRVLGIALPEVQVSGSIGGWIAAGLLVGFGTQLGGGCTSGHGVCGLARFSVRSLVATLLFMFAGGMTVFVVRHVLGG